MEKKLFLLDAYALIYRAHFAFINNPRINSKGLNTSAIFGFCNSLLEVINNHKPTHLGVVFDPPGGSNREEVFSEYKANRQEMPEDIMKSIPDIFDILNSMNIPTEMVSGFEADDLIGTLSKQAEKQGYKVFMMTPDKDFGQLVHADVKAMGTRGLYDCGHGLLSKQRHLGGLFLGCQIISRKVSIGANQ